LLPRYATVISDSKKFITKKIDGGAPSKLPAAVAARRAFFHGGGCVMKMTAAAARRCETLLYLTRDVLCCG
jgi:hypothetical protein